jgi:hypothetical protein
MAVAPLTTSGGEVLVFFLAQRILKRTFEIPAFPASSKTRIRIRYRPGSSLEAMRNEKLSEVWSKTLSVGATGLQI